MSQITRGREMRSQGIRNGGGVCVYSDDTVVLLRLVDVERTSCCLVEARVLSSSFGLLVVDLCLRD